MAMMDELRPVLEKRFPAAFVAAFLLQSAGALVWAGSAAERIDVLERTLSGDQAAIERVAVLEEDMRAMKETLERIETKLDRVPNAEPMRRPLTPLSWPANAGHPAEVHSNF